MPRTKSPSTPLFPPRLRDLPAHCVVRGSADPHEGANNSHFAIGFEVRLPDRWSGRFLFQGGGGNDGAVANVFGNNTGGQGSPTALARGFAVAATDGGHTARHPAESFGFDPQARIDHAYNAYGKTTLIAKALIRAYYGKNPDRSYVIGCSGGGAPRHDVHAAFPRLFRWRGRMRPRHARSSGATISTAWESKLYRDIAPAGPDGGRILSQAFTNDDLTLLSKAILKTCDELDGATDGAVDNYQACKFDPKTLQCAGAKDATCLGTAAQVSALAAAFAGPHDSAGQKLSAVGPGIRAWPHRAGGDGNWARDQRPLPIRPSRC